MTVLVVGNATVDLSYTVARLPAPGETLLADGRVVDAGGKGLNQAVVAHRAGAEVRFHAAVGTDSDAGFIESRMAEAGLSREWLIRQEGATDQSIIWLAADGENVIVSTADRARALPATGSGAITGLGGGDLLLMQGNLTRETTRAWLEHARATGLRTVVNPAPIHFDYDELWPLIDVAVVNAGEARHLGASADAGTAAANLHAAGVDMVVVTLGADGVLWHGSGGSGRLDAPRVQAVDTTGAGDVFCGVLAAGLAARRPLAETLAAAVRAAAIAVTRRGTGAAFPSPAELRRVLSEAASTNASDGNEAVH